jgi:hypothetical protein
VAKTKRASSCVVRMQGFVVKDDIEYGAENIIPLWMFGLTY